MCVIAQVYPDLKQNLNSDKWLYARAILAPRNDIVNSINNDILKYVLFSWLTLCSLFAFA